MRDDWLTFAEAGKRLGFTARTIKRWMRNPALSAAISAVRCKGRWRIPKPRDHGAWEFEARLKLKAEGIVCREPYMRDIDRMAANSRSYWTEFNRLYLAASWKALATGRITSKAKSNIDRLCLEALELLRRKRLTYGVETLETEIPSELKRYWPRCDDFKAVSNLHVQEEIEEHRRISDFTEAARILWRKKKAPTGRNFAPLLHKNGLVHFNDTKEKVQTLCKDFREPQGGISLREFRRRYPLKSQPWSGILIRIFRVPSKKPLPKRLGRIKKRIDPSWLEDPSEGE